jgi:hypothetical protein
VFSIFYLSWGRSDEDRTVRTLADYRPQHDDDCEVHRCECGSLQHFHKHTYGGPPVSRCGGPFKARPCSCGLDALLSLSASGDQPSIEQAKKALQDAITFHGFGKEYNAAVAALIRAASGDQERTTNDQGAARSAKEVKARVRIAERQIAKVLAATDPSSSPASTETLKKEQK